MEEYESGRTGTLGKRVKGNLPWVRTSFDLQSKSALTEFRA